MTNSDLSFKPVKPHGNIGDRGNDGWCADNGTYYQVYAPEDLPNNNDSAIAKMKADFKKLKDYWDKISPLRQYYFVINDKYRGASPHIYNAIKDIEKEFELERADVVLSHQLENQLFSLSQDVIQSIIGSFETAHQEKSIHQHLVDEITEKMYLRSWPQISDNLIANSIPEKVIDGFNDVAMTIFKTVMPNTLPSLERSIHELAERTEALVRHFTASPYAFLTERNVWCRDMRWKSDWINDQDEYNRRYQLHDDWRKNLYDIHWNLVHALNLFAAEVRAHINDKYFMRQQFTLVDSMGTYNGLDGYEAIPSNYRSVK